MSDKNPAENIIDRTTVQRRKTSGIPIFQNYSFFGYCARRRILLLLAMVGIHRPFSGDEKHYFETIILFEQSEVPQNFI